MGTVSKPVKTSQVVLAVLLVGLAAAWVFFQFSRRSNAMDHWVGQPLPRFEMTDIRGQTLTSESLKGKVVLIDFWATWCGPCVAATPMVQALHDQFSGSGLVVIGANLWETGQDNRPLVGPERAAEYARKHNYTFTFTFGNEALAQAVGITGIPTMLVLDKEGIVRKTVVGYGPGVKKDLERAIKPLLN